MTLKVYWPQRHVSMPHIEDNIFVYKMWSESEVHINTEMTPKDAQMRL